MEFNEFPENFSALNSIGRPQMLDPQGSGQLIPIVKIEIIAAIKLDSFCSENNYECHRITREGELGKELCDSNSPYENYIAFPIAPINFFTIVLNGQPFIQYDIEIFKQIPFKWHWHIIEGVADLNHDTSWSVQLGEKVNHEIHKNGLS